MKNAFKVLILIFASLLLCSCVLNDRILYDNRNFNYGIRIWGRIPWGFGFFFIPTSASSRYHVYDYLEIDYSKIKGGILDNINFYVMGKKLNLGSVNYNDVLDITPNLPNCKKIVQSHHYARNNEKEDEISFYFGDDQKKRLTAILFFFESDTKKITSLCITLPFEKNLDDVVKFENIDKSIEVRFPFHGKDVLLIFGEDGEIRKNYTF
jgi:hypothetical protein